MCSSPGAKPTSEVRGRREHYNDAMTHIKTDLNEVHSHDILKILNIIK